VAGLPQEVLLEGELHGVGLWAGDEQAVLAGRQHLLGQDEHTVVAGVEPAHGRDVPESLWACGCRPLIWAVMFFAATWAICSVGSPVLGIPTAWAVCQGTSTAAAMPTA
jgi:hypothetical protein